MAEVRDDGAESEIENFKVFLKEFKNESDRASVILGAAKLDILLYQLLSSFLVPSATGNDELLDGDSPLSTFSSKINLCYRLGLIDKDLSRALHLIRKIRNSFAHEITGTTLESGGHGDRVRQLVHPLKRYERFESLRVSFFDGKKDLSNDFRLALCICILRLLGAIKFIKPIIPYSINGYSFIPPKWKEAYKAEETSEK